ncbi:MAG: hypothetical protein J4O12_10440, partial [Chloroflexi bacterium]|nr:hypothetical protein [Chloroflexota bacterium]
MSKLRSRALPLALVAAALLLAACGGDTTERSPTPSPSTTTNSGSPTSTTAASPTPSGLATATANDTQPPPPATAPPAAGVTILSPVDKDHALPADYVPPTLVAIPVAYLAPGWPGELRQEAVDALVRMLDDAAA